MILAPIRLAAVTLRSRALTSNLALAQSRSDRRLSTHSCHSDFPIPDVQLARSDVAGTGKNRVDYRQATDPVPQLGRTFRHLLM